MTSNQRVWLASKGNEKTLRLTEADGWEVHEVTKAPACNSPEDIRQSMDLLQQIHRDSDETSAAPLFPPTEPWPHSLGEQCLQYWGRIERRCQLTQGHEGACYFCVPAYAIRTDIPLDRLSEKAKEKRS